MAHFVISDKIDLPGKGEDYVVQGYTEDNSFAIACIADGVSRSEESKQGSLIAAQTACRRLKFTFENEELNPDYNSIYSEIVKELNHISESHILLAPKHSHSLFATTLITGFINESAAQFSFVGNGAIIQIRKEWWDLTDDNLLLLGIMNYLNPHILLKDGDTPLYKVLKVDQDLSGMAPDVITINSNTVAESIFLICSDGLCTSEDFTFFHHPEEGDFYRKENPRLMHFLQTLKKHKENIRSTPDEFIIDFRESIVKKELINDDLSYALFIP